MESKSYTLEVSKICLSRWIFVNFATGILLASLFYISTLVTDPQGMHPMLIILGGIGLAAVSLIQALVFNVIVNLIENGPLFEVKITERNEQPYSK
jgi:hypothetical protein